MEDSAARLGAGDAAAARDADAARRPRRSRRPSTRPAPFRSPSPEEAADMAAAVAPADVLRAPGHAQHQAGGGHAGRPGGRRGGAGRGLGHGRRDHRPDGQPARRRPRRRAADPLHGDAHPDDDDAAALRHRGDAGGPDRCRGVRPRHAAQHAGRLHRVAHQPHARSDRPARHGGDRARRRARWP